jgi:hypothetical protein
LTSHNWRRNFFESTNKVMLGYLHQDKAEAAISAMRDQRLVVPLIDHIASQMHHQSGTDIALVFGLCECKPGTTYAGPGWGGRVEQGAGGRGLGEGRRVAGNFHHTEEEEDEVARGASQRGSGVPRAPEGVQQENM